jgi:hypothetical protein
MSYNRALRLSVVVALSLSSLAPTGASAGAVFARAVTAHPGVVSVVTIGGQGTSLQRPPEKPPVPIKPFIASSVAVHAPVFGIVSVAGAGGGSHGTGGGGFAGGGGGSGPAGNPKHAASK